jgi:hypothetical protein
MHCFGPFKIFLIIPIKQNYNYHIITRIFDLSCLNLTALMFRMYHIEMVLDYINQT